MTTLFQTPILGRLSSSCGGFGSLIVLRLMLPRTAPGSPSSLMSRSTVHRATDASPSPRCRFSVSQSSALPHVVVVGATAIRDFNSSCRAWRLDGVRERCS